jgi:hypothetical protein
VALCGNLAADLAEPILFGWKEGPMKMSAADIRKYPKFAEYVRNQIPKLVNVAPVVRSLKTEGGFTEAQAKHALLWGNDPLILITDLSGGQCGVPSAYGCTRQAKLNQIEIDEGTVKEFEASAYSLGVGKNVKGQNVFIVGVTLLHELSHLGNFKLNKVEPAEAGFALENDLYGQSVP